MSKGKISNVHSIVDIIIDNHLKDNSICIDATLGNGKDAVKIYDKLGDKGFLYAFDIQSNAIHNSTLLFEKKYGRVSNISFIKDSHSNIREYINDTIDFFIMNLGYLPGGDKDITTTSKTCIEFLDFSINNLNSGGIGIIVFYPGHTPGLEELENITIYLSKFDQRLYNIVNIKFLNQKSSPPQLAIIERK